MIFDTSALIAISFKEPERDRMLLPVMRDSIRMISAGNWLEANIVTFARQGNDGVGVLEAMKMRLGIVVAPMNEMQTELARLAFMRFGKGVHPARLNFGDCMAYALSKESGEPLLFKGDDFTKTDVMVVGY
jgi:ribonuclease VapC